jgi:hypothetical protein
VIVTLSAAHDRQPTVVMLFANEITPTVPRTPTA